MKILLIEPNVKTDFFIPITVGGRSYLESPWAGYLAAIVGKEHNIEFINCAFPLTDEQGYFRLKQKKTITDSEVVAKFKEFSPSIVGFSVYEDYIGRVTLLSKKFKKINPKCKIILGGHYPSFTYKELLKKGWCDIVVVGEGFVTIRELVSCLDRKGDLSKVKGIAYLENSRVHYTGIRGPLRDLGSLPFPDREIYPKCKKLVDNCIFVLFSTGCPWGRCKFCSIGAFYNGPHYVMRSAKSICDEIDEQYKNKEVPNIYFINEGILYRLNEIIDEKRRHNLNFNFIIDARIDEILKFKDTVAYAKKNGLESIFTGPENFSDRILKIYGKGITSNQTVDAFNFLDELGVRKYMVLIPFSPWITPEELLYNLRMILNYAVWKDSRLYYVGLVGIYNSLRFYAGTELQMRYGKDLDYEYASIKRAFDAILSVKNIDQITTVGNISNLYRSACFLIAGLTVNSIRGDDTEIGRLKSQLGRLIENRREQCEMGLNKQYTVINEDDTPCVLYNDFAISRLKDLKWRVSKKPEGETLKKSEKPGMLIPVGGPYLVDVLNKKIVPITKEQLVYAQYVLMGLTEEEIRKQLKYEKLPYKPCEMEHKNIKG